MYKRFLIGSGITLEREYQFSENITLRPVTFPTNHVELADFSSTQICYGFLCALAETFTFELEARSDTDKGAAIAIWNSQWLLILLSVIARSPVTFPIHSLRATSELSRSCCSLHAALISPANLRYKKAFTHVELERAKEIWPKYDALLSEKAFSHAASVATLNFNETKADIRMAAVWSAIEALIGVSHELSYRIPLTCSLALETDKERRLELFEEVQELYHLRSRCVHGDGVKADKLEVGLNQSHSLLCRLIEWTCERGEVLTAKQAKELPIMLA